MFYALNRIDNVGFTKRELLERCASTALNSKLICGQKSLFAPMAVDAVMHLDEVFVLF